MINFYQLQTFVTVISEGSMTGAADKLYLTQPAVSQQIRGLEDELGVDLLVRGVRQIKPTLQGELLFENAKRILNLVQQTEVAIKTMGAELKGQLRVGSLNSIGLHLMSPVLTKVLKHNPNLQFSLEYGRAEDLVRAFKKYQLDAVIVPRLQEEYHVGVEGIEERPIQREEMWLVASGKEQDVPREIALKDLGKFPLVSFIGEYPHFSEVLGEESAKLNLRLQPVFESSNVGTLKRVIESGLGWGFLPSHSIRKQVKLGRMSRVLIQGFHYSVDICLYSHKNEPNQKLMEVFYNSLLTQERG